APIAIGLLATASLASPAFARGVLHLLDPAWNPDHIRGLPAEVRNNLAHVCANSQAEHQFASYSQNSRVLVLHCEHVRYGDRGAHCAPAGRLHQVYTSTGGRYRLIRSYHGSDHESTDSLSSPPGTTTRSQGRTGLRGRQRTPALNQLRTLE